MGVYVSPLTDNVIQIIVPAFFTDNFTHNFHPGSRGSVGEVGRVFLLFIYVGGA